MTYRVKDNLTPAQIDALVEALHPFYAFGDVLANADGKGGSSTVTLYDGEPDAEESERGYIEFDNPVSKDAELVGVMGSWKGVAGTFIGPVLDADAFFKARDVFLSVIEEAKQETKPCSTSTTS